MIKRRHSHKNEIAYKPVLDGGLIADEIIEAQNRIWAMTMKHATSVYLGTMELEAVINWVEAFAYYKILNPKKEFRYRFNGMDVFPVLVDRHIYVC